MTPEDKQLLIFAAKAEGTVLFWDTHNGLDFCTKQGGVDWNPLKDDGDALRLAVKLKILIDPRSRLKAATSVSGTYLYHEANTDEMAATRRAIVRAAAEIGRKMQ